MNLSSQQIPVFNPRLLDFFLLTAVVLQLNAVLPGTRPLFFRAAGVAAISLLIVLWMIWRKGYSAIAAIGFSVVALSSYVLADSMMGMLLQWVAIIVLSLSFPTIAGQIYGGLLVMLTAVVHIIGGSSIFRTLTESLVVVVIAVISLSFAQLMLRAQALDRQRRRAFEELKSTNRQLRSALDDSRDLVLAEERNRVAAALHDGLGHRLTTIGLSLDFAGRMINRDPPRAGQEIRASRQATSEALAEMRATVRAMAPVELAEDDIPQALEKLAASFAGTGLTVEFEAEPLEELPEPLNQLLLRFTQEALTNVVRHSRADTVRIQLSSRELSIEDNGIGGTGSTCKTGFGLTSLRRRAAALRADVGLAANGGIDGGFRITLNFSEEP